VEKEGILLTPTEFDLLYHLMVHAGQVFSSERLLQEVWDFPYDTGSTDLVRAHVKNLRDKIEPDPKNPIYVRTIPRHGYVISE
jgi:DNA-binding response OmpR family regulator